MRIEIRREPPLDRLSFFVQLAVHHLEPLIEAPPLCKGQVPHGQLYFLDIHCGHTFVKPYSGHQCFLASELLVDPKVNKIRVKYLVERIQ
jgi:hypothetical protein